MAQLFCKGRYNDGSVHETVSPRLRTNVVTKRTGMIRTVDPVTVQVALAAYANP